MDKLPATILHEICTFMDPLVFPRPALATISRQWQMAIERQVFKQICLKSSELRCFEKIVQTRHRRRYINEINYIIELPAYSDSARCQFEFEEDRQVNNEAFTAALRDLFLLLKSWDLHVEGSIQLTVLDVYSVTDHEFLRVGLRPLGTNLAGYTRLGDTVQDREVQQKLDLWNWRHTYSHLDLVQPELPTVFTISSFSINGATTRKVSPCAVLSIAMKLPKVRDITLQLHNTEMPYIAFRRLLRQNFHQSILTILPKLPMVQSLRISTSDMFLWSPTWGRTNLTRDNAPFDSLCTTIRTTTTKLSTLKSLLVSGSIDASLLWPGSSYVPSEPYWQNLERLTIFFSMRRPCGGCYFRILKRMSINAPTFRSEVIRPSETKMPPGYGSRAEEAEAAERFSVEGHWPNDDVFDCDVAPDDDALTPLFEAFGKACLQIRALQTAELTSVIPVFYESETGEIRRVNRYRWGVIYLSPGASIAWPNGSYQAYSQNTEQRRVLWSVRNWRPSPQLSHLFQNIGRERYGDRLIEKFLDFEDVPWAKDSAIWRGS
jgi:hypothetical protein